MQTLTLFEHERRPFPWSGDQLVELERLNEALGTEVLRATTYRGRKVLKATEQVGVVRFGRHTVQILPKIKYSAGEEGVQSATRNLLHMLEAAGEFRVREHDLASLLRRGRDWFEILTHLFATHLADEWQRGAPSNYQSVERTQTALKGKWRIADQLRRPSRQHLFDVTYDEFTVDNRLNRVFRYVVELLWAQTRDADNRRLLGELRQWMEGVTLLGYIGRQGAPSHLITRLNRRFEPLLNLARTFLAGHTIQLGTGSEQTFAFVFDMNALFEAYIINLIRRYRTSLLPTALADVSLHPQTGGHTRHLAQTPDGRELFRLQPDLAFRRGSQFPLLLDTKYKRLQPDHARLGISQGDFYQMFAYAHRYRCPGVLLLYPQYVRPLRARFPLSGLQNVFIFAATVNLHLDLSRPAGRSALLAELRRILEACTPVPDGPDPFTQPETYHVPTP